MKAEFFVEFYGCDVLFVDIESESGDRGIPLRQRDHVTHESRGDALAAEVGNYAQTHDHRLRVQFAGGEKEVMFTLTGNA